MTTTSDVHELTDVLMGVDLPADLHLGQPTVEGGGLTDDPL
jgi:hypothetical protein